jgi:hypothetical protein
MRPQTTGDLKTQGTHPRQTCKEDIQTLETLMVFISNRSQPYVSDAQSFLGATKLIKAPFQRMFIAEYSNSVFSTLSNPTASILL